MTWALPAGLVGRAFENIGVSLQCGEGHSIPVAQVWLIQPVRWLISSDAVAQKLRAGRSPHPIFALYLEVSQMKYIDYKSMKDFYTIEEICHLLEIDKQV